MYRTSSDAKIVNIGYTTSMAVKEIRVPSRGMQQTDAHMVSVMSRYIKGKSFYNKDRLPSECDEFLITWTSSVTNGPLLAFAEYEPDALLVSGGKWYLEDDMREFKDVNVIAWMPLPEPWKGADDE